jgi:hypothetical protein
MHVCHVCHQPTNYYKSDFSISLLTKPQSEQRNQQTVHRYATFAAERQQTNKTNKSPEL